jgi:TRAP-type C4-dicarboxylate transport system permease small subunit
MAFSQVIMRNFFGIGINALEEIMRNSVLWIALIGGILTTLRGKHIAIDIVSRILPNRFRPIHNAILNIFASLVCLVLTWLSIQFLQLEIEMGSKIARIIPAWIIEIILPVGFFLLAISFFLKIFPAEVHKQ